MLLPPATQAFAAKAIAFGTMYGATPAQIAALVGSDTDARICAICGVKCTEAVTWVFASVTSRAYLCYHHERVHLVHAAKKEKNKDIGALIACAAYLYRAKRGLL